LFGAAPSWPQLKPPKSVGGRSRPPTGRRIRR